jgi:hypothetical protein
LLPGKLTLRLQRFACFALPPAPAERAVDNINLILFGNGRKREDFPIVLCHYMSDQVVLMEQLHNNNDDDAALFAV